MLTTELRSDISATWYAGCARVHENGGILQVFDCHGSPGLPSAFWPIGECVLQEGEAILTFNM